MKRVHIELLVRVAPFRKPGYLEAARSAGKPDGEYVVFSDADYASIRRLFGFPGLGDRAHQWLAPIARFSDRHFGTHLARCQACERRRRLLNRWGRFWRRQG